MFRIEASGRTRPYCDGFSRRNFLQLGVAGMASVGLPTIFKAREAYAAESGIKKDTSVIMLWLDGGPSHMDLYDMKPEAPAEYRGIWTPMSTSVPGIEITEMFPKQAKVADKFSIVRSLYHNTGDHFAGGHHMLTGRAGATGADTAGRSPSIGSIATKVLGARREGIPPYVSVPYASSIGLRPGYFGANYLGMEHNPFETDGDPNAENFRVNNMQLTSGLTLDRLNERRSLVQTVDRMRRDLDASGAADALDRFQRQAYNLVTSTAAIDAFDMSKEPAALREKYGRNSFGQSALLARRLVEAGSTFVTVHSGGWDHHWDLQAGMNNLLPQVDAAISALFQDLSDRGSLGRVMVMLCGEFSRTPRMNDGGNGGPPMSKGTPGRDHWGNSMFCLIGGGGIQGGRIVGSTDRRGEAPKDRPVSVGDLHATIYHVLGVDPYQSFLNHSGRPVPAIDQGQVIHELL